MRTEIVLKVVGLEVVKIFQDRLFLSLIYSIALFH